VFGPRELTADAAAAYTEFKAQPADAWRSPQSRSVPRQGEDDRNDNREPVTDAAAAYADYCTRVANAAPTGSGTFVNMIGTCLQQRPRGKACRGPNDVLG
jgi:hypothetical protein